MFGIPYARATATGVVCPVCSKQIVESRDNVGESTTNNYAAHYAEEHHRP